MFLVLYLRCLCNCAVAAILASVLLAFVVVIECSYAANCSSWCGRLLDFVVIVVASVMLQDVDDIVVLLTIPFVWLLSGMNISMRLLVIFKTSHLKKKSSKEPTERNFL
ncbi:hypothetical protein QVD17_15210 [Tagetes erecta]|uniref:Uncharacterized protein n=1 Tax=Tagetes erecta TaxID=13708 RepID=A0AAD8KSS9_TARER|nr:hypothetical protein QVD17_15210 [Tagetes erecta]